MDLQPPNFPDKYASLDNLIQAINTFASSQGYAVVKRRTKVSKKGVLRKGVLMCNQSKEYHTESWSKRETASRKTGCPFDALAVLEPDG